VSVIIRLGLILRVYDLIDTIRLDLRIKLHRILSRRGLTEVTKGLAGIDVILPRARAPVNSKSRSVRDEKDPNVRLKSISITSETSAGR